METCTDESAALPSALAANTRRRIVEKSTQVPVATHKGIDDGYCEKAMRIASVEQAELRKHYGVVKHGSSAQMGKTIELLWATVAEKNSWMELEESQSLDSCQTPS